VEDKELKLLDIQKENIKIFFKFRAESVNSLSKNPL
jgi:hypothetical protein